MRKLSSGRHRYHPRRVSPLSSSVSVCSRKSTNVGAHFSTCQFSLYFFSHGVFLISNKAFHQMYSYSYRWCGHTWAGIITVMMPLHQSRVWRIILKDSVLRSYFFLVLMRKICVRLWTTLWKPQLKPTGGRSQLLRLRFQFQSILLRRLFHHRL